MTSEWLIPCALTAVIAIPFSGCNAAHAESQAPTAQTGVMVWAAFQCSTYASLANNSSEKARLFTLGYESGKRFLEAIAAGKIAEADITKTVPIGITVRFGGPSADFVLGAIYANAEQEARDRVVKTDYNGLPLALKDWVIDPEVQKIKAETQMQTRNCALLK